MGELHQVCLLLGSNIEPDRNIPRAVHLLGKRLHISRLSSVWESASTECCYPDYLNLAMLVSTELDAIELKEQLIHPLEAQMGRVRTEDKNASRPIDIDIILFDGELMDPSLMSLAYLAVPVSEIFPDYRSEAGEALKDIAKRLAQENPVKLREDIILSFTESG